MRTSMPTEGSSTISTRTPAASHFATLTFCWLPPESSPTGCASDGVLTSRRSMAGAARSRTVRSASSPARFARPAPQRHPDVVEHRVGEHEPLALAILAHVADPVRADGLGHRADRDLPAVHANRAGRDGPVTDDRLRELAAPGADEPATTSSRVNITGGRS